MICPRVILIKKALEPRQRLHPFRTLGLGLFELGAEFLAIRLHFQVQNEILADWFQGFEFLAVYVHLDVFVLVVIGQRVGFVEKPLGGLEVQRQA